MRSLYELLPWWMRFRFVHRLLRFTAAASFVLYQWSTAWRMHIINSLRIRVMRHLLASFILRSSFTKLQHGALSQLFVNERTSFMYMASCKCSSLSSLRDYNNETVNNRRKLNQRKLPPRRQHVSSSWFLSSFLFATFLWHKGPNNHLPIMVNLDKGRLKLDSPWFLFLISTFSETDSTKGSRAIHYSRKIQLRWRLALYRKQGSRSFGLESWGRRALRYI
jgi:hypothetical protein